VKIFDAEESWPAVGWTSRLRDDAYPFVLDLLLTKDGWRYRTLHQDLSSVSVRQNLMTTRGKLVTVVADFRQILGINFNGLHCWVFEGGWYKHSHGCHE
jgi:hypothetical protein